MYEQAALIGLYAETALHPGSGTASGVIDLPVQREVHTGLPPIPGSSLKGVMQEAARRRQGEDGESARQIVFGPKTGSGNTHGGSIGPCDARLLAFPVRALQDVFVWVTCPLVLSRLRRDLALAGFDALAPPPIAPGEGQALVGRDSTLRDPLVLEDMEFALAQCDRVGGPAVTSVAKTFEALMPTTAGYDYFRQRLHTHLAVIEDHWFAVLTRKATAVVTRIKLNPDTKTTTGPGGNMWTEELLPSDCLFYTLIPAMKPRRPPREADDPKDAAEVLEFLRRYSLGGGTDAQSGLLQVGGDETVGHGWVRVRWVERPTAASDTSQPTTAGAEPAAGESARTGEAATP